MQAVSLVLLKKDGKETQQRTSEKPRILHIHDGGEYIRRGAWRESRYVQSYHRQMATRGVLGRY